MRGAIGTLLRICIFVRVFAEIPEGSLTFLIRRLTQPWIFTRPMLIEGITRVLFKGVIPASGLRRLLRIEGLLRRTQRIEDKESPQYNILNVVGLRQASI